MPRTSILSVNQKVAENDTKLPPFPCADQNPVLFLIYCRQCGFSLCNWNTREASYVNFSSPKIWMTISEPKLKGYPSPLMLLKSHPCFFLHHFFGGPKIVVYLSQVTAQHFWLRKTGSLIWASVHILLSVSLWLCTWEMMTWNIETVIFCLLLQSHDRVWWDVIGEKEQTSSSWSLFPF